MIGRVRSLVALALGVALSAVVAAPALADVQYASCADAHAAGAAPMRVGEPGYRLGLDRDRDGVACEDGADENPAPIEKPVCPDLPPSLPIPAPTDDDHIPTVPDPKTPPPAEEGAEDAADRADQDGDKPEGEVVEDDQTADVVSDNPVRFQLAETPQAACPSTTAKPAGDSDQVDGDDNTAAGGQGGADGDSLPVTGAPVQLAVLAGLVLLVAGASAVVMVRRRTRFTA
jgi:LPXTG-motif cell wall-anchored protein